MGWYEGEVDGKRAKVKEDGKRVEAIYNFQPDGSRDHIATNDGINASYVREGGEVLVDDDT